MHPMQDTHPQQQVSGPLPGLARKRSFTSSRSAEQDVPFPFDINGTDFIAYPGRIPGAMLADATNMAIEPGSKPMWDVFEAALGEEEFPRFKAFLLSPANRVDAELLSEIIQALGEESTGRPTTPSSR